MVDFVILINTQVFRPIQGLFKLRLNLAGRGKPIDQKASGYYAWQGFLNLGLIFTSLIIFTWFGSDVIYNFGQFWNQAAVPTKSVQISQISSQVVIQSNLSEYFQHFNNWLGGSAITPIAGQSATELRAVEASLMPVSTKF